MLTHRRKCLLKCLFGAVLVFLCIQVCKYSIQSDFLRELQQSGRNFAALEVPGLDNDRPRNSDSLRSLAEVAKSTTAKPAPGYVPLEVELPGEDEQHPVEELAAAPVLTTVRELSIGEKVKQITQCMDRTANPKTQQRGDYWVLYNYVRPNKVFRCHESVTYTTHADYSFLDNLLPLLERWKGPISVALHAPGADFQNTLDSIAYLRDCASPLVKEFVTFHVYFSTKHVPKQVPRHDKLFQEAHNCSLSAPYLNVSSDQMYKSQRKLLYPVNVGRNIARETARTHFILPSDIELYPIPSMIERFLEMIADNSEPLQRKNPKVYPIPLFEVLASQQVPENKTHLKEMLSNGTAFPFHKKLCPGCHNVPKSKEWMAANETDGLHIFHIGKRMGYFVHWEPIFIGTHADPLYDERLSWEGKSDKMTQGYALCVLDYDFLILDNAFLVHKPGIKVYKRDQKRAMLAGKTNQLIKRIIFPELKVLYGFKKGCAV